METLNTTLTETVDDVCSSDIPKNGFNVFYLALIVVLVLCNGSLLAAIGASWSALRHNIVYCYSISCLLSVICFCVVTTYEILHTQNHGYGRQVDRGVLQSFNQNETAHWIIMHGWSYRKGLIVCLLLVIELNIAVLIHAVSDNALFVGRYSGLSIRASHKPKKKRRETRIRSMSRRLLTGRRSKALLLIVSAWVVPLVLSIPTAFTWNCVENCQCLPATRKKPYCLSENGLRCSHKWQPMSQSFLVVIFLLFCTIIVFMFAMLIMVARKFYRTYKPRKSGSSVRTTSQATKNGTEARDSTRKDTSKNRTDDDVDKTSGLPSEQSDSTGVIRKEEQQIEATGLSQGDFDEEKAFSLRPAGKARTTRPPLHNTIKLVIALTLSLFLSVSPLVIIYLYDVVAASGTMLSDAAYDVPLLMALLHAASQPVILLKYMNGLRKSCVDMLLKLPCLRSTETVIRRVHSVRSRSRREKTPHEASSVQASDKAAEIVSKQEPSAVRPVDAANCAGEASKEIAP